ncbi:MAG: signal recognition particle receptor subunit alpha, partial [Pseudomonadota bacterium]
MNEGGWIARLRAALGRSAAQFGSGLAGLFDGKRRLDDDLLEELEEMLIRADLGVETAGALAAGLAKDRFDKAITAEEAQSALAQRAAEILRPCAAPPPFDPAHRPFVTLVIGVNGVGKTTTIGKLAQAARDDGRSVMIAAGDTFRAAAAEQLEVWGERVGAKVIRKEAGADAAGLAFEAAEAARADGVDQLFVDTAGRLHNKADLMAELAKIRRALGKAAAGAPHATLLVLDATTGQNAIRQVEIFKD